MMPRVLSCFYALMSLSNVYYNVIRNCKVQEPEVLRLVDSFARAAAQVGQVRDATQHTQRVPPGVGRWGLRACIMCFIAVPEHPKP